MSGTMSEDDDSSNGRLRTTLKTWRRGLLGIREGHDVDWYWAALRSRHPPFATAVLADAQVTGAATR